MQSSESAFLVSIWPDSETTQQLLAGVRDGREQAVDQLLDQHRGALRRMVTLRMDPRLARRVDASDIVQDVLVEASRRLTDYLGDPVVPFSIWLRRMARDRLIDAHRRHRVAARRSLDREQPLGGQRNDDSTYGDPVGQLRDSQLTPARAAIWNELAQRFEFACQQLEPLDQEIILMRHFEQLSNSEAAAALELSPQAASMRYLRALRRLRQLLPNDDASA